MIKLTRTIHQPEGIPQSKMEGFFLLSPTASAIAINSRLTGTQFRLWHYLMALDSFADETSTGERIYHNIPAPKEIAAAIGCSPRTVEKDMKRLEEVGLYASRVTQWQGYNLSAAEGRAAAEAAKKKKADRRAKVAKALRGKDGYLAANPVKLPLPVLNKRNLDKIAEAENAKTQTEKELQAAVISPHTIQTSTHDSECVEVLDLKEQEQEVEAPSKGASPLEDTEVREEEDKEQELENREVEESSCTNPPMPHPSPKPDSTTIWRLRSQFEAIELGTAPPDAAVLAQCYEFDPALARPISKLLMAHPEWELRVFNGTVVSADQVKSQQEKKQPWLEMGKLLRERNKQRSHSENQKHDH